MDNAKKAQEINILYKGTFETELGRRCLETMKKAFVDRPTYRPGMSLDEVAFREGEASIVRKIIAEVENGTRTTSDTE